MSKKNGKIGKLRKQKNNNFKNRGSKLKIIIINLISALLLITSILYLISFSIFNYRNPIESTKDNLKIFIFSDNTKYSEKYNSYLFKTIKIGESKTEVVNKIGAPIHIIYNCEDGNYYDVSNEIIIDASIEYENKIGRAFNMSDSNCFRTFSEYWYYSQGKFNYRYRLIKFKDESVSLIKTGVIIFD
jgi:hypothetical protein